MENCRYKYYCGELVEIMLCSKTIFNGSTEPQNGAPRSKRRGKCNNENQYNDTQSAACGALSGAEEESENDNIGRAQRRAKKAVFDLCGCNSDLDLFCTFTLDAQKIDRYDYKTIYKKLRIWLDNRVRRDGLKYVLVAEHHKDGAIHFHALCNSAALHIVDSKVKDSGGHNIYNLPAWKYGFSTAIKCYGQSRAGVCSYITKYITKSDEKIGGRWYYHGGDLNTPEYDYKQIDYDVFDVKKSPAGFDGFIFQPDGFNAEFKIFRKKEFGNDNEN